MKKVAYLGIPGSYSYIAGYKYFHGKVNMKSCMDIKQIFDEAANNDCGFGIVPLENSTTGSIAESYDLLLKADLSIVGEIILQIHHNILVNKITKSLDSVRLCLSHSQAINQCEGFLEKHREINTKIMQDSATSAKTVSESKKNDIAAIGSMDAVKLYNLKVLEKSIEDNPTNFTRFVIIGKNKSQTGNKASLIFSVVHKPGSLLRTLSPYAKYGLNLTKIESRPVFGKPWEYVFLLDLEFGNQIENLHNAIKEMKEHVNFIKILGIYEKGKIYES